MKKIIEWHEYPDEKPRHDGKYLCKVRYLDTTTTEVLDSEYYHGDFLTKQGSNLVDFGTIEMWAEMPRGVNNG